MIDQVFPFTIALTARQSVTAISIGYLPVLIVFWLFWRMVWDMLHTLVIHARELIRGKKGMYLYCFPKHQPRETGDIMKLKYKTPQLFGSFKKISVLKWLLEPFPTFLGWLRNRKNEKKIPFLNLKNDALLQEQGIKICHGWFRPSVKIHFYWEETNASGNKSWKTNSIMLYPDKEEDVVFNENYQMSLQAD